MQEEEEWQEVLAQEGSWQQPPIQDSTELQHQKTGDSPATGTNDAGLANELASNSLVPLQNHVAQTSAAGGPQGNTEAALVPANADQVRTAELMRLCLQCNHRSWWLSMA